MAYARPVHGRPPRSLRRVATVLGAADDGDVEPTNDGHADYVAWAAAVKRYGGIVAAAPAASETIAAGDAAARYPRSVIAPGPTYELSALFKHWPDLWTGNSDYGWYRAPASVLAYTNGKPRSFWDVNTWLGGGATSPITDPQTVPGETAPKNPDWYEQILTLAKFAPYVVGGLIVLQLLNALPRGRRE